MVTRDAVLIGFLVLGSVGYLAVGLAPFSFDLSREPRLHLVFVTPWNGLLNFLCFLPFGFLIAKLSFVHSPLLAALWICGALSLAVEAAQMFLPGRFCCLSDWVLNTSGAVAGAWLAGLLWSNG